jgi:hypothetical protein
VDVPTFETCHPYRDKIPYEIPDENGVFQELFPIRGLGARHPRISGLPPYLTVRVTVADFVIW